MKRSKVNYGMPDGEGTVNRDSLERIEIPQAGRRVNSLNVEPLLTYSGVESNPGLFELMAQTIIKDNETKFGLKIKSESEIQRDLFIAATTPASEIEKRETQEEDIYKEDTIII